MRIAAFVVALFAVAGCKGKPRDSAVELPVASVVPPIPVPPAANAVASERGVEPADPPADAPPLEQARAYEARGQSWMARLVLEKKALSEQGTEAEVELLARICHRQDDAPCVDACVGKLGRKISLDAGPSPVATTVRPAVSARDADLARARDLLLNGQADLARKLLEPKAIEGKASTEELRLLREVCRRQGDRMCQAFCDGKLR